MLQERVRITVWAAAAAEHEVIFGLCVFAVSKCSVPSAAVWRVCQRLRLSICSIWIPTCSIWPEFKD